MLSAADRIAALKPSYISVTYGAGGGTSKKYSEDHVTIHGSGMRVSCAFRKNMMQDCFTYERIRGYGPCTSDLRIFREGRGA